MFDIIAPRYDRFTRVFSFGMDRRWKAELIAWMRSAIGAESRVMDLACGTGDLAFAAAERATRGSVVGIDASSRMIELARARATHEAPLGNVRFRVADMSSLGVDTSVAQSPRVTDSEMSAIRVRRSRLLACSSPGRARDAGLLSPESPVWRSILLTYLKAAGNWVGWLWHREPVVYGYIAPSIDHFVSWQRFSATLERHGLRVESVRVKLLGGVALHFARRG